MATKQQVSWWQSLFKTIRKMLNRIEERYQIEKRNLIENDLYNWFGKQEVESHYVYPMIYKPKWINEQTNILRQLFPDIGFADEKIAQQPLPANAEGWFAIPRWQAVGRTYNEAVQVVLDLVEKQRKGEFCNWCKGKLGTKYLRQSERTIKKLETLAGQQKGYDILIVAVQLGLYHRGRSVRRSREAFIVNEFGLGAFEIGCMLLTHPERLQHNYNLYIDCAGDEYASVGDGDFSHSPFFYFFDGEIKFGAGCSNSADPHFSSVSGFLQLPIFLPQLVL